MIRESGNRVRKSLTALLLLSAFLLVGFTAHAQEIQVRAGVERTEVYTGEAFIYQIQIQGTNKVPPPTVRGNDFFDIRFMGGQDTSSRVVMSINGKMTEEVNEGINLTYQVTPRKAGSITIPAVSVVAGGATHRTNPVQVRVLEPQETDDVKLRLKLSRNRAYVGEPVILTVTWYLARDIRQVDFTLPVLSSTDFEIIDPGVRGGAKARIMSLPTPGGGEIKLVQGQDTLDGHNYTTLSFRRVLIPRKEGTFDTGGGTLACEVLVGRQRQRSPFDDFFNMGSRGTYKRVVSPSNNPRLEVRNLPLDGRPPGFSGNVGKYEIETSALPTDVKVGDPITLTLRISGSSYISRAKAPRMSLQEDLTTDFKVPEEMAPGKVSGGAKVFNQTLRAKRPEVKEIPPIEFHYFDTAEGRYKTAKSEVIPITVEATRVVTAWDAEGASGRPEARELQTLTEGIAANYEDSDVLGSHAFGNWNLLLGPSWLMGLGFLPLSFVGCLIFSLVMRKRRSDPGAVRARGAHRALKKRMAALDGRGTGTEGMLLEALRAYLGARLRMPPAALTFVEVEGPLRERGISEDDLRRLEALILRCEAGQYAGEDDADGSELVKEAALLTEDLERNLQ